MNVLVIWAGVADPLRPLPGVLDGATLAHHVQQNAVPSPFDEAALEVALKLRDRAPQTRIAAWCAGGEALARKLAAFPVEAPVQLRGLPGAWDAAACAASIAALRAQWPFAPDVVLLGREFGDWDDGAIPALLAEAWQMPYVSLTTAVEGDGDGERLLITRQRGAMQEQMRVACPVLCSVTNAPNNKLRHPLLKNVMLSKKLVLPQIEIAPESGSVALARASLREAPPRAVACEMLAGSVGQQAQALAQRLTALLK
jgi:electron transfer flavoprotein beta subunit